MVPAGDLQATVQGRRFVDADHRGEKEIGVGAPARLLVLMEFEPAAAGQLEIDLVFEQDGLLAEQLRDRVVEFAGAKQAAETIMVGGVVFQPVEHPSAVLQAFLEIHHVLARGFGPAPDIVDPGRDFRHILGRIKAGNDEVAVVVEGADLRVRQRALVRAGIRYLGCVRSSHHMLLRLISIAARGRTRHRLYRARSRQDIEAW